jgi:Tol biopolymer transport system component
MPQPAPTGAHWVSDDLMYLSQPRPGLTPEIFAPGIVSHPNQLEFNIAFTPDGREIYYTVIANSQTSIMFTKLENGSWTTPGLTPFSRSYANWSPFISPDGLRFYFVSDRPTQASGTRRDPNIWVVERDQAGWTEPECLSEPINSLYNEYTPFLANDGTFYLVSDRPGGYGQTDIYSSKLTNGKYSVVENLGQPINTVYSDEGMLITRDDRYMILTSNRPGTEGDVDLYFSVRNEDSSWQVPRNLGGIFNTKGPQYAPRFSPDDAFFFFFSEGDLYWVDSKVFDAFK